MEAQTLPKIRVVVRKRPLNTRERNKKDRDILTVEDYQTMIVEEEKQKVDLSKFKEEHKFRFDNAFGEDASNEEVYQTCVQPIIAAAFEGAKVSCFAYGQTGSGKTFTMMGPNPTSPNPEHPGVYLQAASDIFTLLSYEQYQGYTVYCSLFEIYCGKLHDLLNKRKEVHARSDAKERVKIMGLTEAPWETDEELMQVINFGLTERTTGSTAANADSSRSHAIMQVVLRNEANKIVGKMSFIDLAGSERGADTSESNRKTRQDGAEINKSLLALKEWIRALDKDQKHTPFRGSKLTQVLKDSFVGNCKTVMIANVSPGASCCENTLNSLRYADRVKELKNENRDKSDTLMLARNGCNTTKKEIKKQHSFQPATITKNKNLPIALQRQESVPTEKEFIPKKSTKLTRSKTSVTPITHPTKTPKYRNSSRLTSGLTSGLQINSRPKNLLDLNENLQNIQHMMPAPSSLNPTTSTTSSNPPKRPFARQDSNQQPTPQPLYQKTSSHDIQMDPEPQPESAQDLEQISHDHESLVNLILQEEEELLGSHKKYIDDIVDGVKKQMVILHEVDKPGSNIEEYIGKLDGMLEHNINIAMGIRKQLRGFKGHLKQEEKLSQRFYEQQDEDMQHNDFDEVVAEKMVDERPGGHNLHDDEFMDDLYDLDVTPSEPNHEDNLVAPPNF